MLLVSHQTVIMLPTAINRPLQNRHASDLAIRGSFFESFHAIFLYIDRRASHSIQGQRLASHLRPCGFRGRFCEESVHLLEGQAYKRSVSASRL